MQDQQRVREFVAEYKDLTRSAANEEEVRSAFQTAAVAKLNIRDLRLEQGRQDIRRHKVIIECKDKGLFYGRSDSATTHFETLRR
jgi:hypothetical protein